MTTRKKIIAIGLCLVILAASILSGTVAYFTDEQNIQNTFTSGNVKITLDESKATLDDLGRVTVDKSVRVSEDQDFGTLYPAQKFTKDPVIKNVSTEAAYIAAKVVITDGNYNIKRDDVLASQKGGVDIKKILSGGMLKECDILLNKADVAKAFENGADKAIYHDGTDGEYVFYFIFRDALAKDGTALLFDTFSVPAEWDNEQMDQLKELKIDVNAYGVQTFGFDSALEALEAAFPAEFDGFVAE